MAIPIRPNLTTDDWRHIREGVELYNRGDFWESHEAWEVVWRRYPDEWRLFLQGLIQMAAGYHQLRRQIYHGVVKHLENARRKIAAFPDGFLGISGAELIRGIDETLARVKAAGKNGLDAVPVDSYPRIKMKFSGDEHGEPLDR